MNDPLYQAKADLFKILGHPVRIRLLEVLAESGHCAADLRTRVHAPAAGLSQQLAVLRRAGLVIAHRDGAGVCFTLATPLIGDLLAVTRAIIGEVLAGQVELLTDLRAEQPSPERPLVGERTPAPRTASEKR